MIRDFREEEFDQFVLLVSQADVEPPQEVQDLKGVCLVAEENNKLVGCMYALVGGSTQAYIDWFVVKKNQQGEHLGILLAKEMDKRLKEEGVKRYNFYVEKHSTRFLDIIINHADYWGIKKLRDFYWFRREL